MDDQKIRNMDEFAAVSGVSRPTISKYFHDPNSVRASTRERIEAALKTHNYRPNIFAINQNRKLTKNVGIVVPNLSDPFFAEVARNLERRCVDAGYRPTLYSPYGDPAMEVEILDDLRLIKPAGVLLGPIGRNSKASAIQDFCADVPTVLFDAEIPTLNLSYVGSDNPQFVHLMVDYLCRTGEPPCFFEMETPSNPNARKRQKAYLDAMKLQGLEACVVKVKGTGWDFEDIGRRGGVEALQAGRFTTNTVLCSNDRLAIGLLTACYEQGIKVGRSPDCQIRIAGMDNHPFSRFTCPPLTTISQDYEAISHRAAETLFTAIEQGSKPDKTILFEGKLVMRESA